MSWWAKMSGLFAGRRKVEMRRGIQDAQQRLDDAHDLDDQIQAAVAYLRARRRQNRFGPAVRAAMRGHR